MPKFKLSTLITSGKPLSKVFKKQRYKSEMEEDSDSSANLEVCFPKFSIGTPSLDTSVNSDRSSRASTVSKRKNVLTASLKKRNKSSPKNISALDRSLTTPYENGQMSSYSSPGNAISVGSKKKLSFSPGSPKLHNKETIKRNTPKHPSPLAKHTVASPSRTLVTKSSEKKNARSPLVTKERNIENLQKYNTDIGSSPETEEIYELPTPKRSKSTKPLLSKSKTKETQSSRKQKENHVEDFLVSCSGSENSSEDEEIPETLPTLTRTVRSSKSLLDQNKVKEAQNIRKHEQVKDQSENESSFEDEEIPETLPTLIRTVRSSKSLLDQNKVKEAHNIRKHEQVKDQSENESSSENEEILERVVKRNQFPKSSLSKSKVKEMRCSKKHKKNPVEDESDNESSLEGQRTRTESFNKTSKSREQISARSKLSNAEHKNTKGRNTGTQVGHSTLRTENPPRSDTKNKKHIRQPGVLNRSSRLTRSHTVRSKDEPLGIFMHKLNISIQDKGAIDDNELFIINNDGLNNSTAKTKKQSFSEPDFHVTRPQHSSRESVKKNVNKKSSIKASSSLVNYSYTVEEEEEGGEKEEDDDDDDNEEFSLNKTVKNNTTKNHGNTTNNSKRAKRRRLNMPRSKTTKKVMDTIKGKGNVSESQPDSPEVVVPKENILSRKRAYASESDGEKEGEYEKANSSKQRRTKKENERPKQRERSVSFAVTEKDYETDRENIYNEAIDEDYVPTGWVGLSPNQIVLQNTVINEHSKDSGCFMRNEISDFQTAPRVPVHVDVKKGNNTVEQHDIFRSVTDIEWSVPNKNRPKGNGLSYLKYFNRDGITMGQMKLMALGDKGKQKSNKNCYFLVVKGKLSITVNRQAFIVISGDAFNVPLGSSYNIQNLGQHEARLSYFLVD